MIADDREQERQLAALLQAVQSDPGNRGLAAVPGNNLFTACPDDFAAACRSIAGYAVPALTVHTGFPIATAKPPAWETDGPLGAVFLARAFHPVGVPGVVISDVPCGRAVRVGLAAAGVIPKAEGGEPPADAHLWGTFWAAGTRYEDFVPTHTIALERPGPAADGKCYTMRGREVGPMARPVHGAFIARPRPVTVGIGDGGNEIGMGKIPHDVVKANIPNGEKIHCRVATDFLIVAGVSNWGAYALAAGVCLLRGTVPVGLFDPDKERAILEAMVRDGKLIDGVTGQPTPTVDNVPWDEYVKPLTRMRVILGVPS